MRTVIAILFFVFSFVDVFSQVPEMLNYQAVARNNSGAAISNQTIKVRLTIVRGATNLYTETRSVTTNLLGLFNVQIGSPGAISSSGDFENINWAINTPDATMLKVELDLNNINVFTDMGTQPFSTVPYAFSTKTAIDVINLAGRYIDPVATPTIGSRLSWNGYAWTPVKKDSIIFRASTVASIPAGGANAPWAWVGSTTPFITLTGNEKITAHFSSSFGHAHNNFIPIGTSVCYQETTSGDIISYNSSISGRGIESAIPVNTSAVRTQVSASGGFQLPAGTYRIGMCIKNLSGTGAPLNNNGDQHGIIEIKY